MNITAKQVKEKALSLGSNLCGIASIDRFSNMPPSSNPCVVLEGAKSVIVIATKFLKWNNKIF